MGHIDVEAGPAPDSEMTTGPDDSGAYLPLDRLRALTRGETLPGRTEGCALFADIAGFTALTSQLSGSLGLRRGAEELPRHLDAVYDALTRRVHAHGGSVISFAGDAITCWFDADGGLRATSCAMALQEAMAAFSETVLPDGSRVCLSLKVTVAKGPVRRMVVGDPAVQLMDAVAGRTVMRLAAGEALARSGEVLVDQATAESIAPWLRIGEWRSQGSDRFAVVKGLPEPGPVPPDVTMPSGAGNLSNWLLPAVEQRLSAGQGEFLTELRPVTAVFVGFDGIDYDDDEQAPAKLDRFIRTVQAEALKTGGSLLQLTVGDKGSYLYLAFGAPVSNEDDARRAVTLAQALLQVPSELGFITGLRIGMSQGIMRTGAYGGVQRRTYGALGDETNMAARLMGVAGEGSILATAAVAAAGSSGFSWRQLEAVHVKGRREPLAVFEPAGARQEGALEPAGTALVGRTAELLQLQDGLLKVSESQGRVIRLTGEAGIGKTRLLREFLARATGRVNVLLGEAESLAVGVPYSPWRRVFEQLLGLGGERRAGALAAALQSRSPRLLQRLPLLAPLLGLALPDNELTASLDAELRKTSREAMALELLRGAAAEAAAAGRVLLVALENEQWFDPLSRELLEQVERLSGIVPLLLVVTGRDAAAASLRLEPLDHAGAAELLSLNLAGRELPVAVVDRILGQAEGNPYYLEQLTGFLLERGAGEGAVAELPDSLHSLVLSRLDRLNEHQKATVKAASVIGRTFRLDWLDGYYPSLGGLKRVEDEVQELGRLGVTDRGGPDPFAWLFRQVLTRDVSYESIPYNVRSSLHERLARYIERFVASLTEPLLELLAFHYGYGGDMDKQREYLLRAGVAAQDSYANEAALHGFSQLLPLAEPDERAGLLQRQGQVQAHLGLYGEAGASFRQALAESPDDRTRARSMRLLGELQEKQGDYGTALDWLEQARSLLLREGDDLELVQVLLAEGGNVLWQQGEYGIAAERLSQALELATGLDDDRGVARALHGLGNIELYQGNLERARELFGESLERRRRMGDSLGIANALNNLGIIAASLSGPEQALELFRETLDIRRQIGDRSGTAVALNNVGFMAAELGYSLTAVENYRDSLRLRRELGDRLGEAVTLNSLGHMQWRSGELADAARSYRDSLQLASEIGNARELAAALAGAAAVAAGSHPGRARGYRAAALGILADLGAATEPEVQELLDSVPEGEPAGLPGADQEQLVADARNCLAELAG